MKEELGLIIQGISILIYLGYMLPRQIADFRVASDPGLSKRDQDKLRTIKWAMMGATVALAVFALPAFIRLIIVTVSGHSMPVMDDIVFWSNRLVFLATALAGFLIYQGNKGPSK